MRRIALLVLAAACDPSGERTHSVSIRESELHVLQSEHVDGELRISVALPFSYLSSTDRYPVVYALDANGWFGTYADVARMGAAVGELPETIVVGVGYVASNAGEVRAFRARDYTPVRTEETDARIREFAPGLSSSVVSGGGEAFSRFLRDELVPFIDGRYRTAPERRVLFGHSFGGLFALYVLFHEPNAFTDYVVGSPSLWYAGKRTFDYEEEYAAEHDELDARVFLSVGSLEKDAGGERSREIAMVDNVVRFSERLASRGYRSLELETVLFEDETHTGVIPPTFSRGLRSIFRD